MSTLLTLQGLLWVQAQASLCYSDMCVVMSSLRVNIRSTSLVWHSVPLQMQFLIVTVEHGCEPRLTGQTAEAKPDLANGSDDL